MQIDHEGLARIAEELFIVRVQRDMGSDGVARLPALLKQVRSIHEAISTERLEYGLTVVVHQDPRAFVLEGARSIVPNASRLTAMHTGKSPLTVQVRTDGSLVVWFGSRLSGSMPGCLSYEYRGPHEEYIATPIGTYSVPTLQGWPSYFSVPYFRDLNDALVHYGYTQVREAQCEFIAQAWQDDNRLIFLPRPERLMRRSLQKFLSASLRDHNFVEVMPEQNVNETRPVDIKVTWITSNRVALIEIKWLGLSARPGERKATQNFDDKRARDGAQQLVDYLELYRQQAPGRETRGYLVVFDGRRHNLKPSTTSLKLEEALFYANADIDYDEAILKRSDFEHPVRLYCRPHVNHE
ncbi:MULTISPECIES: hypothetical protein [unclassified Nonomuraea]|uniref:hypothetical protein n=1 Tax=unclassified Nonomuraea TaxID=2593643 RepID=UPI0033F6C3B9